MESKEKYISIFTLLMLYQVGVAKMNWTFQTDVGKNYFFKLKMGADRDFSKALFPFVTK